MKKPTLKDVQNYCKERNNNVDAEQFINFYDSKDWKIGKNPMKNWQAAIRTWETKNRNMQNVRSETASQKMHREALKRAETRGFNSSWAIKLFDRFLSLYGRVWTSQFPTPESEQIAADTWVQVMKGVEPETIKIALNKLFDNHADFPPNALQFRKLCDDAVLEVLGVPPLEHVFMRVMDRSAKTSKDHAIIFEIQKRIPDIYTFRNTANSKSINYIEKLYKTVCNELKKGIRFDKPAIAKPEPKKLTIVSEDDIKTGKQALKNIMDMFL